MKLWSVYVTSGLVETDQSESLWFTKELRKVGVRPLCMSPLPRSLHISNPTPQGRSEIILAEAAAEHRFRLEVAFAWTGAD